MSHELIDCNTHEIVGGFAISDDTVKPAVRILTSPWDAKNVLPTKLFTSGTIKSDFQTNPWSSLHLTNREVTGAVVRTQASSDINKELFNHPFTPHVAVFETYPASEGEKAHWHLKISPFMDKKTQQEISAFLNQFDPNVRNSIGRDIADNLPVCQVGDGEMLSYRAESVEIEVDDEISVLRYGLEPVLGWETECELNPMRDDPFSGYDTYEASIGITDIFFLLSDLPVPDWEVLYGVRINNTGKDIYQALEELRQDKGGFTVSEVYRYIKPYIKISRKEEGGVE